MLIRHIVTAILATASLLFTFKVTKSIAIHFFDEIFVKVTNFETCDFDSSYRFATSYTFDLYEDVSNAFQSVHSEPVVKIINDNNINGDSAPSSSSPPSESSPSSPAHTAAGHGGYTVITVVLLTITIIAMRSSWFKRRQLPPPPPPPPLPPPPPPPPPLLPPPPPLPLPPPLPPPVSVPPNPAPAPAVKERLALVAAPARQVAGARRKSRRAKKTG